jgi:hypothetical protein
MDQGEHEDNQIRLDQKPPRVSLNLASLSPTVNYVVVDVCEKQPHRSDYRRDDQIDYQFGE